VEDDEETDEDVVVVGRSPLAIVPTNPPEVVVAEVEDNEDGEVDEEDEVVPAAAVPVDIDCVVSVLLITGLAPTPMTGWGLEPPGIS